MCYFQEKKKINEGISLDRYQCSQVFCSWDPFTTLKFNQDPKYLSNDKLKIRNYYNFNWYITNLLYVKMNKYFMNINIFSKPKENHREWQKMKALPSPY